MVIFPNSSKNQNLRPNPAKQEGQLVAASRKAKKNQEPGLRQNLPHDHQKGQPNGHQPGLTSVPKRVLRSIVRHDLIRDRLKDLRKEPPKEMLKGLHKGHLRELKPDRWTGQRQSHSQNQPKDLPKENRQNPTKGHQKNRIKNLTINFQPTVPGEKMAQNPVSLFRKADKSGLTNSSPTQVFVRAARPTTSFKPAL